MLYGYEFLADFVKRSYDYVEKGINSLNVPEEDNTQQTADKLTYKYQCVSIKNAEYLITYETFKYGEVLNETKSVNSFDGIKVCVMCCEENHSIAEDDRNELFNEKSARAMTKRVTRTTAASTKG